jgi:hypothetical protein
LFGIAFGNKVFKIKKSFLAKVSFFNFSQKCVLTIFRVKNQSSTIGVFNQTDQLFVKPSFLDTKSTF